MFALVTYLRAPWAQGLFYSNNSFYSPDFLVFKTWSTFFYAMLSIVDRLNRLEAVQRIIGYIWHIPLTIHPYKCQITSSYTRTIWEIVHKIKVIQFTIPTENFANNIFIVLILRCFHFWPMILHRSILNVEYTLMPIPVRQISYSFPTLSWRTCFRWMLTSFEIIGPLVVFHMLDCPGVFLWHIDVNVFLVDILLNRCRSIENDRMQHFWLSYSDRQCLVLVFLRRLHHFHFPQRVVAFLAHSLVDYACLFLGTRFAFGGNMMPSPINHWKMEKKVTNG